MLHTGTFRDIDLERYDEIWLCVRSLKNRPNDPTGVKIKYIPALSPSSRLFGDVQRWKRSSAWNQDKFDTEFAPRFKKEMTQPAPQRWLNELAETCKTKEVLIVCYCQDENMCHRTLVAGMIRNIAGTEFVETK